MTIDVIFNPEASERVLSGIRTVARAASVTFGSSGPSVVIQHRTDGIPPIITRDGVTVANSIQFEDRVADLGARMLRDVAGSVSREVGDGTTTAIVLAQTLAIESIKSVAAGFHPLQIKQGLEGALAIVEAQLQSMAIIHSGLDWLESLAMVATKQEQAASRLLAKAHQELDGKGELSFELGNSREDELEIVDGLRYEQGYLSPYFVTDKDRAEAVLDNPYILLYDREIGDLMDLIPILEQVREQERSLLIIAENVIDKALTGLLLNHVRGVFRAVAVKPPGFGDRRRDRLNDLAVLTGGQAILEDGLLTLDTIDLSHLGQARRVIINELTTTIIGATGDPEQIEPLIARLTREADLVRARRPGEGSPTGNLHELEELEERINALSGKNGIFKVGGSTDFEIKERMVRIENAYKSIQAAMAEGVIPGCGIGLYRCIEALREPVANDARQHAVRIMQEALRAPTRQLLINSGINPETVFAVIDSDRDLDIAFDTIQNRFGNCLDIGVVDSVKVVRLALRNAVSVITTLITAETVLMHVPDLSIMAGYSPEWAAATREDPRE
ncbi:chaperonin GroEL [Methylotuvimicrobium buryatense]|uniref:60 kDa chaperonin n=1 Tax=Methylotuvimicrobium buryatense TaxID=95641 RepID=A0A4P9UKZ6_METBY|nr:chaperonin GroEL [Methylotuvimicrobium buryatense]QCW81838.1 chaperonin GroEL [Methylotuvimicrobium buryatense]